MVMKEEMNRVRWMIKSGLREFRGVDISKSKRVLDFLNSV